MNHTITFTFSFTVAELVGIAFLGGSMFCTACGLIAYKFDFKKFIKDMM